MPAPDDNQGWTRLLKSDVNAFNQAVEALAAPNRLSLRGADLSGMDLTKAFVSRADLTGASLRGATVQALTLATCRLQDADLAELRTPGAGDDALHRLSLIQHLWRDIGAFNRERQDYDSFDLADFSGLDFQDANLKQLRFGGAKLDGANLSRCDLYDTTLARGSLVGVSFHGATLSVIDFEGAVLSDADFADARLATCTFIATVLDRTRFTGATMENCPLARARSEGASFAGAQLTGSGGNSVSFRGVSFRAARATRWDLTLSSLIDCDFRDVVAKRARIAGCDIAGSDFTGATGLEISDEKNRESAKL